MSAVNSKKYKKGYYRNISPKKIRKLTRAWGEEWHYGDIPHYLKRSSGKKFRPKKGRGSGGASGSAINNARIRRLARRSAYFDKLKAEKSHSTDALKTMTPEEAVEWFTDKWGTKGDYIPQIDESVIKVLRDSPEKLFNVLTDAKEYGFEDVRELEEYVWDFIEVYNIKIKGRKIKK